MIFVKNIIKDLWLSFFWTIERIVPRNKNKWVFGAWFGDRYTDNSRAMYEYAVNNLPQIKPMWLTRNPKIYERLKSEGKPVEYLSSWKGRFFALTAKIAFVTVSDIEVNGLFLNGARMIRLWHGMPLKHIGIDQRKDAFGEDYYNPSLPQKVYRTIFNCYKKQRNDCVLITGSFFSPFFQSSFNVPENKIWNDGYPRNDELFSPITEPIITEYRMKYPHAKFVVFMPTHRTTGPGGTTFSPFDGFGFDRTSFFNVLEKNDIVFFYKGHFFDTTAKVDLSNDRFVRVTDDMFDVLYRFVKDMDILITDYSSIYFDYILLGRPIILTPFDYEDYILNQRHLYFDYDSIEAAKAYNWDQLLHILEEKSYQKPSKQETNRFIDHVDANSCKRIAEHIFRTFLS